MDDWQVGDLALCVADEWVNVRGSCHDRPRKGWIGVVAIVAASRGIPILAFDQFGLKKAWGAAGFRKINNLTDEERESFLADLREPVEV